MAYPFSPIQASHTGRVHLTFNSMPTRLMPDYHDEGVITLLISSSSY